MQLIVAWPNWNTRADRCLMFSSTGEWLDQVHLLTAKPIEPSVAARLHPNTRVIYLGEMASGWSFMKRARSLSRQLLAEATARNQRTVLHDLAVGRLIPKPRGGYINSDLIRTVVSFYSPTVTNWTQRAWRTNRDERLPWKQEVTHLRAVLPRIPLEFCAARFADAVTGNSEQIREDVIGTYGKNAESVFNMPTEVDIDFFRGERRATVPPKILFCGRLYSRKGIFDLLEAARIMRQQSVIFTLQLVGHNSVETDAIRQRIQELNLADIVKILPHQSRTKIRDFLHTATILVLPSYLEGSPRVVKEAMAAGCPVVTYDIPGTRTIDPSERSLILIPLGDIAKLAAAMMSLLHDEKAREALGVAGRIWVEENYGVSSVALRMVRLYESLFP